MQDKKFIVSLTKVIVILALIIAAISSYIIIFEDLPNKPIAGKGTNFDDDAQIGGEFVLTDHHGNEFRSDSLKGKYSLVYFGFTFCPDICPTSLQKLTKVVETLDKYRIDTNVVFITIDPARDNVALLKEYLGHFYSNFIGLTGSEQEIRKVSDLFKVYYAKVQDNQQSTNDNNNDGSSIDKLKEQQNYMIDHTSFVYLLDKNGKYVKLFHFGTNDWEIIEFIRTHNSQVK